MSALSDILTAGAASLEADTECQITLPDGSVAPCTVGLISNGRDPMFGGEWVTYEGTATLRASNVANIPREGNSVIYNGQTMYCATVEVNGNLGLVIINLSSTPMPK